MTERLAGESMSVDDVLAVLARAHDNSQCGGVRECRTCLRRQHAREVIQAELNEKRMMRRGIDEALSELGIPTDDYPAPVANAVRIL